MNLHFWCVLVLFFCSSNREMVMESTRLSKWHSYHKDKGQNIIHNLKRHSDGTFTSDFVHFLDKIRAKDFVEWLAENKQNRCHGDLVKLAAQV